MRTLRLLGFLPLLLTSLACSTTLERPATGDTLHAQGPGTVFSTIEDAAVDALTYAHTRRFPTGRPHILAGTIQRAEGGFSYTAPQTSDPGSALSTPTARFRLGPNDVASYVAYSTVGDRKRDHRNESLSSNARTIVDELDPLRRALYFLTPSLRVVSYDGTDPRDVAQLGADRTATLAASDR